MFGLMQKAQERQMALVTESESQALLFFQTITSSLSIGKQAAALFGWQCHDSVTHGRKAADWNPRGRRHSPKLKTSDGSCPWSLGSRLRGGPENNVRRHYGQDCVEDNITPINGGKPEQGVGSWNQA